MLNLTNQAKKNDKKSDSLRLICKLICKVASKNNLLHAIQFGQSSNRNLFRNLLFNNIFLANCRIVTDMTQSTRRKYYNFKHSSQLSSIKLNRFVNSCSVDAEKNPQRNIIVSFVRCNWNEIKSNPSIDFMQSIQITRRSAFETLLSIGCSSIFFFKKN